MKNLLEKADKLQQQIKTLKDKINVYKRDTLSDTVDIVKRINTTCIDMSRIKEYEDNILYDVCLLVDSHYMPLVHTAMYCCFLQDINLDIFVENMKVLVKNTSTKAQYTNFIASIDAMNIMYNSTKIKSSSRL